MADQAQEEVANSKQQNQNWVAANKPNPPNQENKVEVPRSLDAPEDYALHYLTRAVAKMMENIGFSTCQESVLNILTDLCRRYLQKLWTDSKQFAEHAGRRFPIFEDANMVFDNLMFSAAELHGFMKQVQHDAVEIKVPHFPVKKPAQSLRDIYGTVSERELAERPEHIPRWFPAVHPEWCTDRLEVRASEVQSVKDTALEQRKTSKSAARARITRSKIAFPDFSGSTAKELGFVRPQKLPTKKVVEEPSGISSSANIAALQLAKASVATNNTAKTKHKKWSSHRSGSGSKNSDDRLTKVKEDSTKNDAVDKSSVQRSSGMFGMPPSALVHPENVAGEKLKKKKKEKDRSKEKKEKHRDKEKHKDKKEEGAGSVNTLSFLPDPLTHGKAGTSSSAATGIVDQVRKLEQQQQQKVVLSPSQKPLLSSKKHPAQQDPIDLSSVMNQKVIIEEKDVGKVTHGESVELRVIDSRGDTEGVQVAKVVKSQQAIHRTVEQSIGDSSGIPAKANEEMKEADQKEGGKRDASKGVITESAKSKSEKRRVEGKDKELARTAKKVAAESAPLAPPGADASAGSTPTHNTAACKDLKTLKVVLSRPSGQKEFTAFSPSSGSDRTAKNAEQNCRLGNVHDEPGASAFTALGSEVVVNTHEKKKKHKKEKDRDKHHGKDHKRKDKKDKEHKKDKTRDIKKIHEKQGVEKPNLKRSAKHLLPVETSAPKIPKLKIRFGANSKSVEASPSNVVSAPTPPVLTCHKLPERVVSSFLDQGIEVMYPVIMVEDFKNSATHKSGKTDGAAKSRKRQPVTKAELKALPKLPRKTSARGTKEEYGSTGEQESEEPAASSIIFKTDGEFGQGNDVQQAAGKRARVKDYSDCFGAGQKVLKAAEKEKSVEGVTVPSKYGAKHFVPTDGVVNSHLTNERCGEEERLKKNPEKAKKMPDQGHSAAEETEWAPPRPGKEELSHRRMCDNDLRVEKGKPAVKERTPGKWKSKKSETGKNQEKHQHDLEKTKDNEREKMHQSQKSSEKGKDHKSHGETELEKKKEDKKEQPREDHKEKGNGNERKKDNEREKGRVKEGKVKGREYPEKLQDIIREKTGMEGNGSHCGSVAEGDKKQGKGSCEEQLKRKSLDRVEMEHEKSGGKKNAKERDNVSDTKGKETHSGKNTNVENKVKGHEKEQKHKEERKKHSGVWEKKLATGGSSKERKKITSCGEVLLRASSDSGCAKTKKGTHKEDALVDSVDVSHIYNETQQKSQQAAVPKEQLSQRCSTESDICGSGSSTADSLTKSSDKKSATLESEDSLDNMWICPECSVAYVEGATDMVGCDACDNWFHWSCVGLLVAPPDDAPWYCQNCAKKKLKKKGLSKNSSKKGKK